MSSNEFNELSARLERIEQISLLQAKPILDIKEASLFIGFSIAHIYRLTSTRQIPHFKKGAKLLFKKDDLEAWMTETRVMTEEETEKRAATYAALNKRK